MYSAHGRRKEPQQRHHSVDRNRPAGGTGHLLVYEAALGLGVDSGTWTVIRPMPPLDKSRAGVNRLAQHSNQWLGLGRKQQFGGNQVLQCAANALENGDFFRTASPLLCPTN